MTEAEWNACTDPQPMLEFLRGKASERKLWLFGVVCCKRILRLMPDEHSRLAVAVADRFVEGGASNSDLDEARSNACNASWNERNGTARDAASAADLLANREAIGPMANSIETAWARAHYVSKLAAKAEARSSGYSLERAVQGSLFRDIFGNPFRPVALDPSLHRSPIPELAGTIYDERTFDRLPILADALEDAGCTNADILNHCRQPGEHVRGCWVVDLLLGKK